MDLIINYMPQSPVPHMYPMFFRKTRPKNRFTSSEIDEILAKNYTYLLPPYHRGRTKKIAWVVSNYWPKNSRIELAKAINEFIPVRRSHLIVIAVVVDFIILIVQIDFLFSFSFARI